MATASAADNATLPRKSELFSARLQLPVTSTAASKQQEKLIIEFDFHEFSTGLDVLQSVAEQIKADYTITTDDGETVNDLVVCVRDVDGADMLPIAAPLVAQPAVFQFCLAHLHRPHRKAPLFAVMSRRAAESRRQHRLDRAAAAAGTSTPMAETEVADAQGTSLSSTARPVPDTQPLSAAIPEPNSTSETSFSTIHFETHQSAGVAKEAAHDGIGVLHDIDVYFPSVVEPQLRTLFGGDSGMPWEDVCSQLPMDAEQLRAADALLEGLVGQWKELRVEAIPTRRHWIHHLRDGAPNRTDWLKALESEATKTKAYRDALSSRLDAARRVLDGAVGRRDASRVELDRLEIAAVHANDTLRRRDDLQEKLRQIRLDAEEFRDLEETLRLRVKTEKERHRAEADNAPSVRSASHASHPMGPKDDGRCPVNKATPQQSSAVGTSDVAGDEYFDESPAPPDNGLGFLSPSLRDKVSQALRGADHSSPDPPAPVIPGDGAASPKDDLRRLALQLTQYLNTASPNPQTRAHLLEQVRQAREAVERRRGLRWSGGATGSVTAAADGWHQHAATPHAGPPLEPFAARWPSTGWSGDRTRLVDVPSMSPGHKYDLPHAPPPLPNRAASANPTADLAALAERAVPFFHR